MSTTVTKTQLQVAGAVNCGDYKAVLFGGPRANGHTYLVATLAIAKALDGGTVVIMVSNRYHQQDIFNLIRHQICTAGHEHKLYPSSKLISFKDSGTIIVRTSPDKLRGVEANLVLVDESHYYHPEELNQILGEAIHREAPVLFCARPIEGSYKFFKQNFFDYPEGTAKFIDTNRDNPWIVPMPPSAVENADDCDWEKFFAKMVAKEEYEKSIAYSLGIAWWNFKCWVKRIWRKVKCLLKKK